MAAAVATATAVDVEAGQKYFRVFGTVAINASPATYATGGLVMDMSQLGVPSDAVPQFVDVQSMPAAGTSPSGFVYNFCPGTTQANGKLAIFESAGSAAALAEFGNGSAIAAGISGDAISFVAYFKKL